jgi:hypothetical protein
MGYPDAEIITHTRISLMPQAQTYANHRRFVPLYHFVAAPIVLFNLGWTTYRLIRLPSVDTLASVLVAIALTAMLLLLRVFPLRAQDRIIRLETRMRLKALLPADLSERIAEFTPGQLIAMRFASDAELPELARTVLKDNVQSQTAIKKMIRQWNADHLRV